jgi:chemotaxis protein methyltransferase CheR
MSAAMVSEGDFLFIRDLVRTRTGIVLGSDKHYLVDARLASLVESAALRSIAELVQALRRGDGPLQQRVVELMVTNETYFFRDVAPFDALHHQVIPSLAEARAGTRTLTFWSAACSTGQEPFSIAMLVKEESQRLAGWNIRIVASDISHQVIARARSAAYSAYEVGRGLEPRLLAKYFTAGKGDWVLREQVRALVEFHEFNLLGEWPSLPPMDVIFLRNMMIYLDAGDKRRLLGRMRQLLAPDGYLFLGGAETTLNLDDRFERVLIERAGCYRLRKAPAAQLQPSSSTAAARWRPA